MRILKHTKLRKSALAAAVALTLGAGMMSEHADAHVYGFSFTGDFTMLTATGAPLANTSYTTTNSGGDVRTPISGTMTFDTVAGTGSGTINSFNFFNGTSPAVAAGVSLKAIGNGSGGSGDLVLGNMLFNWNGNNGIPVSIVLDATGLFTAANSGLVLGSVINQSSTGDVLPASNAMAKGTKPIGLVPVATTTWNTTTCAGAGLNSNPSGCLPLVADTVVPANYSPTQTGVGGSPMIAGPFVGYNANFDITNMTVTSVDGATTAPAVLAESPPPNTSTADPRTTTITVSFTQPMDETSVASAFTLAQGSTNIPGTVTPDTSGQTATVFTFTPSSSMSYSTTYTATVAATASGPAGSLASAFSWSFTTKAVPVSTSCTGGGPAPTPGQAGNFTMLTPTGTPFGGTNDVAYTYSGTTNTAVNGTDFNMTLASATPEPFFGFDWSAHDIRVFGPGSYTFNTGCTVTELHNGVLPTNCAIQPSPTDGAAFLTMNVGAGQLGALMLFDWHGNDNIYVADVWNQNAQWQSGPGSENGLWTGPAWGGPAGYMVDPATTWALASTPDTSNGINGTPMVNGPFVGFSANFNLNASDTCRVAASAPIQAQDTKVSGCTLSPTPVNLFKRSDWLILLGFVGWLGWWRRKRRA